MIQSIILTIYAIMLVLALIYIVGCLVAKRELSSREKHQEHIDDLVEELSPPTIQTPDVQTAIDQLQTSNEDLEYQEAKRNMVANIRTYFNQRKKNTTLAIVQGPHEYRGPYEDLTYPTPPSIERISE